jgi:hypothetical protein
MIMARADGLIKIFKVYELEPQSSDDDDDENQQLVPPAKQLSPTITS